MKSFRLRALSLLLAAVMLLSCGCFRIQRIPLNEIDPGGEPGPAFPDPEPEPEPESEPDPIDETLLSESLALCLVGWGKDYLDDANGLWGVIGYYAALTGRINQTAPWLSDSTADALRRMLRPGEEPLDLPTAWFGDGSVERLSVDGHNGLSFPAFSSLLDATLGIWREIGTESTGAASYTVTVTDHLDDGTVRRCFVYTAFDGPSEAERGLVYLFLSDFSAVTAGDGRDPAEIAAEQGIPTYEELRSTNTVMNLLALSRSMVCTNTHTMNGEVESESVTEFYVEDAGVFTYVKTVTVREDGQEEVWPDSATFWDGDQILYATLGSPTTASAMVPERPESHYEEEGFGYPGNDAFSYDFYNSAPTLVSETDETITFRVDPEILEGEWLVYTVDRATSAMIDINRYSADGVHIWSTHMEYTGGRISDDMESLLGEVHGMRNAVVHLLYMENGESVSADVWYHLPRAWEISLIPSGEFRLFDSPNLSVPVDGVIAPGDDDIELWASAAKG